MRHPTALAASLASLLALTACGGSGGDGASDVGAFAGLWDASERVSGGARDERYVGISADGRYVEYDYRQDGVADDGNCHVVTAFELESLGRRLAPGSDPDSGPDGSLTDGDIVELDGEVSAYRLPDGRTIDLFRFENTIAQQIADDDEALTDDDLSSGDALLVWIDDGSSVRQSIWPAVSGQSPEDLERCDGV